MLTRSCRRWASVRVKYDIYGKEVEYLGSVVESKVTLVGREPWTSHDLETAKMRVVG